MCNKQKVAVKKAWNPRFPRSNQNVFCNVKAKSPVTRNSGIKSQASLCPRSRDDLCFLRGENVGKTGATVYALIMKLPDDNVESTW
jgi:hypothetical protein